MLIQTTKIIDIVTQISDHVKGRAALLSIAEHTAIDLDQLVEHLNTHDIKFMGGIFPKVIHDNLLFEQGIVVNTLNNLDRLYTIRDISTKSYSIPEFSFQDGNSYSLVTYVDGLTTNISHYLGELYETYGMRTNYFGGGAGSLSLKQGPCIISNDGVFQDAAVVGIMRLKSHIGVAHGWKKVDGPFIITKAEGNTIKEINWRNPFEVYKEVVEEHSGKVFRDDNFFDIAKGYPFGILKEDADCVVRDPLSVNDNGELICVGELEDNTLVDILSGNEASLIKAANNAAISCLNAASNPTKGIIIDCISRILFLEENFNKELSAITKPLKEKFPAISIGGALTLGEISSYGEGFLELYNKTTIVGLFEV